jgi:hypothetical protein
MFIAARRRGDECDTAALAVEQHGEIQLARDGAAGLDVNFVHRKTCGAGLRRDEALAKHRGGGLANFRRRAAELHAARLAASARMHLRLHDPHRSRDFARRCDRLRFVRGDLAGRNRHAVFGEDALRLVFVKVHLGIVSKALNRVANAARGAGFTQGA